MESEVASVAHFLDAKLLDLILGIPLLHALAQEIQVVVTQTIEYFQKSQSLFVLFLGFGTVGFYAVDETAAGLDAGQF